MSTTIPEPLEDAPRWRVTLTVEVQPLRHLHHIDAAQEHAGGWSAFPDTAEAAKQIALMFLHTDDLDNLRAVRAERMS